MIFFASAAFLAGTAAVVLPLILHFLRKRPEIIENFPSFMFLGESITKLHSRNSLRRLLVLLLRCLAFIFLSLAFAWPYMQDYSKEPETATVLLIDNSFSMNAKGIKKELDSKINGIISHADKEDPVAVALVSRKVKWHGHFTSDPDALRSFLKSSEEEKGTSTFENAIRQADMKLQEIGAERKRIVIVTDRQMLPWRDCDLKTTLSPGIKLELVSPEDQKNPPANAAIIKAGPEGRFTKDAGQIQLYAEIVNYSAKNFDAQIRLKSANDILETRLLKLNPYGSEKLYFKLKKEQLSFPMPCSVELLVEDDIQDDNIRYFALNPLPPPIVMLNQPENGEDYIKTAFNPEEHLCSAECRYFKNTDKTDFSAASLVIAREGFKPDSEQFRSLKNYVQNGGNLVFVWKDSQEMRSNLCEFEIKASNRLRKDRVNPSEIDFDSQLFRKFREAGTGNLFEISFRNTASFSLPESAVIPASLAGGSPLLCEIPYGQGRIFAIASGLSKTESDWGLSPSFLVFWRELLKTCTRNDMGPRLSLELDSAISSGLQKSKSIPVGKTGNYTVTVDGTPYILSINLPAQESDTMQMSQSYPWQNLVNADTKLEKKHDFLPGDSTTNYWRILLVLGLLCAASELFIANRTAL